MQLPSGSPQGGKRRGIKLRERNEEGRYRTEEATDVDGLDESYNDAGGELTAGTPTTSVIALCISISDKTGGGCDDIGLARKRCRRDSPRQHHQAKVVESEPSTTASTADEIVFVLFDKQQRLIFKY
ncbi:unnamed protein product [Gongylonema pulchrum]|uniref:Uncharacterized protein n=1 Tax=Gongylonema pulchrum TaxID=637853 RepID=A0A183EIJ0_9BILA|nr:unnamed protein product [Gongylonema pulchrum]